MNFDLVGEEEGDEGTAVRAAWAVKHRRGRRSSGGSDGATAQSRAEMRNRRRRKWKDVILQMKLHRGYFVK
jgi:hypothetical protein